MNLIKKLLQNSTVDIASSLEKSIFFNERDMIPTEVPMVNVALSGRLDGGLTSGVTVLAGPPKNFKSMFGLLLASSYLNKYPDSAMLFYDSEFGTPKSYFKMFSIPEDRVLHTPITDIDGLKHDFITQLKGITRGEKVVVFIDSLGQLASTKEIEDTVAGKQVADMTRAKGLKSLFRMATPYGGLLDIPIIMVNHTYQTLELYSKQVVGGGTGAYYSADTIWIIGRQQEKDNGGLTGYNFIINVEKSRFVKEKSKIPISVTFASGIQKWAGMFDVAVDLGFIISPSKGWYETLLPGYEKVRRNTIEYDSNFWKRLLLESKITEAIQHKYSLGEADMLSPSVEDQANV